MNTPRPHYFYLFEMRNGKKKLAWGPTPEAALETLLQRSSEDALNDVIADRYEKIQQRDLAKYARDLG